MQCDNPLVQKLAEQVKRDHGGLALLVGGAVRDMVMGVPPNDWDLEVFGVGHDRLDAALQWFADQEDTPIDEVGRAFGIWKMPRLKIDVSIPRRDSKVQGQTKSRGIVATGDPTMTIQEAAMRRDFTCNGLSWDPLLDRLFDPCDGVKDIALRNLRIIDPLHFWEDPVRLLRAMQLCSRRGFTVDPESLVEMKRMDTGLQDLPQKRIWDEFEKLMMSIMPSTGLFLGRELGVVQQLWPELEALVGCEQEPEWHPEGDVWVHTLQAINVAAGQIRMDPSLTERDKLNIMLGTLCHDMGKPTTTQIMDGRVKSHAHDSAGVPIAEGFLKRLGAHYSADIPVVLQLVEHHLKPAMLYAESRRVIVGATGEYKKTNPSVFRRLAKKVDLRLLPHVAMADSLGRLGPGMTEIDPRHRGHAVTWFWETAEGFLGPTLQPPPPLIQGRDLLDLGMKQGPAVGQLLAEISEMHMDGQFATNTGVARDEAIALAAQLIKTRGLA